MEINNILMHRIDRSASLIKKKKEGQVIGPSDPLHEQQSFFMLLCTVEHFRTIIMIISQTLYSKLIDTVIC